MKIAMIGSGAAGSVFAAYLKRGGADMYLVDKYKAHMDKIAADGLTFRCKGEECVLTGFHTTDSAAKLPEMGHRHPHGQGHADRRRHARGHELRG